jgi:hypothetical protein
MRLAAGIVCLVIGLLLVGIGLMTMLSYDGYDTTLTGHIVLGLIYAVPGLVLGAGGMGILLRYDDSL